MSIEDTIGYGDLGDACVVCGKALGRGQGLATLYKGQTRLPICCPLCLEAYQNDPKPYLERLAKRGLLRESKDLENPPANDSQ